MFIDYENFCFKASLDDNIFNNFKRNKYYTQILEHVSYDLGNLYYNLINDDFKKLKFNDSIGNPIVYNYGKWTLSPTTLRYIKIAQDIKDRFNSLDNFNIVEIGGGYGGQFLILDSIFNIKSYIILDLDGACQLTKKYTNKYNYKTNLEFSLNQDNNIDLIISNYAFSELSRNIQDQYFKDIILKSEHGFMILNTEQGFTHKEFLKRIPQSTIVKGEPFTGRNFNLTW